MRFRFLAAVGLAAVLCFVGCKHGSLAIEVASSLDNPIAISLQGLQGVLHAGMNMTVVATTSVPVDWFQWYLDSSPLSGEVGSSITLGSGLGIGKHCVSVVAARGQVLGSTSATFQIIPVPVDELVSQISESEIYATVSELQGFVTREVGYQGNLDAGTYVYDRFAAIPGLSVDYLGGSLRNVVATLPGVDGSNAVWMVGAHYDSTSSTPANAPGATDNGCGVGIVLELARIMSKYRFKETLKFAIWNSEEEGQVGSRAYAVEAKQNHQNIKLYVNFDSAGYDPYERYILDIMSNASSSWVADMMTQRNSLYQLGFSLTYNIHDCYSDHRPFWEQGFPAVMTHSQEHGPAHSPADTVDKISTVYAKRNGQIGMAILAELAGLLSIRL